jgi:hypothetical protein
VRSLKKFFAERREKEKKYKLGEIALGTQESACIINTKEHQGKNIFHTPTLEPLGKSDRKMKMMQAATRYKRNGYLKPLEK